MLFGGQLFDDRSKLGTLDHVDNHIGDGIVPCRHDLAAVASQQMCLGQSCTKTALQLAMAVTLSAGRHVQEWQHWQPQIQSQDDCEVCVGQQETTVGRDGSEEC